MGALKTRKKLVTNGARRLERTAIVQYHIRAVLMQHPHDRRTDTMRRARYQYDFPNQRSCIMLHYSFPNMLVANRCSINAKFARACQS